MTLKDDFLFVTNEDELSARLEQAQELHKIIDLIQPMSQSSTTIVRRGALSCDIEIDGRKVIISAWPFVNYLPSKSQHHLEPGQWLSYSKTFTTGRLSDLLPVNLGFSPQYDDQRDLGLSRIRSAKNFRAWMRAWALPFVSETPPKLGWGCSDFSLTSLQLHWCENGQSKQSFFIVAADDDKVQVCRKHNHHRQLSHAQLEQFIRDVENE